MEYSFSWGAFLFGLMVLIAGACLTLWYRPISDMMGGGVSTYDRYRLYGLITCGVGLVIMLNLHTLILGWLFSALFNRG